MTNLRENQKTVTKKPKLYGEVLVSGRKMFFLVFLGFFWFCLVGQNSSLSTEKDFYETSRKPKNQKNKTFWRSFGFRSKDGFFLVFLEFFCFFWFRFLKTKKTLGFFGFLKEVLLEERQKNKKTQGFFGFLVRCLEYMYEQSMKKTKKPWVFLVFCLTSSKTSFKKPKKPKVFFGF